jgi:hypothetical protein
VSPAAPDRTVEVLVEDGEAGYGTGFRISDQLVLTCRHVLRNPGRTEVRVFSGGTSSTLTAERVWVSAGTEVDLALLRIPSGQAPAVPAVPLGELDPAGIGRVRFQAWGFPKSHMRDGPAGSVRDRDQIEGEIPLGANPKTGILDLYRTDTPGRAGDRYKGASGGPVFVDDRLVGVLRWSDVDGPLMATRVSVAAGAPFARLADEYTEPETSREEFRRLIREAGVALPPVTVGSFLQHSRYGATTAAIYARCPEPAAREHELAVLHEFTSGDEPYLWLAGQPYAGKTTLAAAVAANPPPGVMAIAFFVSRADGTRLADFRWAIADQLAILAEEDGSRFAQPTGYDINFLWQRAAERVAARGDRLLLVVDGLDEDDHQKRNENSIASQLPEHCPARSQVLVTSRLAPSIAFDVAETHPIRHCRRESLEPNEFSRASQTMVLRDLHEHLRDPDRRDVLALLAAAGGHLAAEDLADLRSAGLFDTRDLLESLLGRILEPRDELRQRRYAFAHDLIGTTISEHPDIGVQDRYRDVIHGWAQRYATAGWPDDTPGYLLDWYPRMLLDTGDTDRLLALSGPRRYRVQRLRTGGNRLAVREIGDTVRLLCAVRPELPRLVTLALWKDHLGRAARNLSSDLPPAWARAGLLREAEDLARQIPEHEQRIPALIMVARVVAESGDQRRAGRLLGEAERSTQRAPTAWQRHRGLAKLVSATTAMGDRGQAEHLLADLLGHAREVGARDQREQREMLRDVAHIAAMNDFYAHAEEAALVIKGIHPIGSEAMAWIALHAAAAHRFDVAESLAAGIPDSRIRALSLVAALSETARAGDADAHARLLTAAVDAANAKRSDSQVLLSEVSAGLSAAGRVDEAVRVAEGITSEARAGLCSAAAARGALAAGDTGRAALLLGEASAQLSGAGSVWEPVVRGAAARLRNGDGAGTAALLTALVRTMFTEGRVITVGVEMRPEGIDAPSLSDRIVRASDTHPLVSRPAAFTKMAAQGWGVRTVTAGEVAWTARMLAAADAGDVDGVGPMVETALDDRLRDPDGLLRDVSCAAATAGLFATAERFAARISGVQRRSEPYARLAQALVETGEIAEARRVARLIVKEKERGVTEVKMVHSLVMAGRIEEAEQTAAPIAAQWQRSLAFGAIAEHLIGAGELDEAYRVTGGMHHTHRRGSLIARIATAADASGDRPRAIRLLTEHGNGADGVRDVAPLGTPIAAIAAAAARAGLAGRAERIVARVGDPAERIRGLRAIIDALPGGDPGAQALVSSAVAVASDVDDPAVLATLLADLARAGHRHSPPGYVRELLRLALVAAGQVAERHARRQTIRDVAGAAVETGHLTPILDLLIGVLGDADTLELRSKILDAIARSATRAGQFDEAQQVAWHIGKPNIRSQTLTHIARWLATAGEREAALAVLRASEGVAVRIGDARARGICLAKLALAAHVAGDGEWSRRLLAEADATVDPMETSWRPIVALVEVAAVTARMGRAGQSRATFARALAIAEAITDPHEKSDALRQIAEAALYGDLLDEAERAGDLIPQTFVEKLYLMSKIAQRLAGTDPERALDMLEQYAARALQIQHPKSRGTAIQSIAVATARIGRFTEAARMVSTSNTAHRQSPALVDITRMAAEAGRADVAEQVANGIAHIVQRDLGLGLVARHAEPEHARELLLRLLRDGSGTVPLDVAARLDPEVVPAMITALEVIADS